jgi:NADH-quinone oxidoreductase subunit E
MGVEPAPDLRQRMEALAARYPQRLTALIPLLYLVQQHYGYVAKEGIELTAEVLGTTPAYVDSVASFYTMLYRQPVGKYVLQVCRTLPCALMGAEEVLAYLQGRLGIKPGETTPDGLFTLETVECLAACHVAPLMMVNDVYKVGLDRAKLDAILDDCRHGTTPHPDEIYPSA